MNVERNVTRLLAPPAPRWALVCLALTASTLLSPVAAVGQPPEIASVLPMGIPPGETIELLVQGQRLQDVARIWTSFPAHCEIIPLPEENASGAARCRLTTPRDEQVGIAAIRAATKQGVSAEKLVMIDDLPSGLKAGGNHASASAQEVPVPLAVDGTCDPQRSDVYRFVGKKGQPFAVEVVAQRLGSHLDATVRLLDAAGQTLASSDDEPGIGADPRLAISLPADGVYYVELRDVQHRGGAGYFYRLRLGNFPLLTIAFPPGGPPGAIGAFDFLGPYVAGLRPQGIALRADRGRHLALSAGIPHGDGSGFVGVALGHAADVAEAEPNDDPLSANAIGAPCTVNGRFQHGHDRDVFVIDAQKDQALVIRAQTRDLGSPADVVLRIVREDGSQVAQADDDGAADAAIKHAFASGGKHFLVVENLLSEGSPLHAYRLDVAPLEPGFSLSTDVSTLNAPQGGTAVVKIQAQRESYPGPIELSVDAANADAQLSGQTIPADKSETTLAITFPPSAVPGEVRTIQIHGRASVGEKTFQAQVSTAPALRKLAPNAQIPPGLVDGLLVAGIGAPFPRFFEVRLESPTIYFPQTVGVTTFQALAQRTHADFKGPIALEVTGLPAEFVADIPPIAEGQAETTIKISGRPDSATAEFRLKIVATGTFGDQRHSMELGNVPFRIVPPLVVQLEPQGPIHPGQRQQMLVRVRRFTETPEPVFLTWKAGPQGLSGPIVMELAADKSERLVEITAAADIGANPAAPLVLLGKTSVHGNEVVVESEPATLVIEPASG